MLMRIQIVFSSCSRKTSRHWTLDRRIPVQPVKPVYPGPSNPINPTRQGIRKNRSTAWSKFWGKRS